MPATMRRAWPPVLLLLMLSAAAFAPGSRVQAFPAMDAPPGNLLVNGGFELIENGRPASWTKTGGELEADTSAFAGASADCQSCHAWVSERRSSNGSTRTFAMP